MSDVMTRTWTVDALNTEHPEVAAAGWLWEAWDGGRTPVAAHADGRWVAALDDGRLMSSSRDGTRIDPPSKIAIAVILASRGLPSLARLTGGAC